MKEPRWLLENAIIAAHSMLLEAHGGATGVRDQDMLSSALNRAIDKYNYESDATIFELAAAYSFGLAKNHPFVDGNKRTAFVAGILFLELNGFVFSASEADSAFMFEELAAGKTKEAELSTWMEHNSSQA